MATSNPVTIMSFDPTTTRVSDWKYVSEGGTTMVFSYNTEKNIPSFKRVVLRLRKAPLDHNNDSTTTQPDEVQEWPDDPSIEFQDRIVSELVPPQYLPQLKSVRVNRAWLTELARYAARRRPETRRLKDDIDLNRTKAVLATDLVGGEGWAVEIKVCHRAWFT